MVAKSYMEADLENIYSMLDRLHNSVSMTLSKVVSSIPEWRRVDIEEAASMIEMMAASIEDEATLFIARYQPLGYELIDAKAAIRVSYDLFRIARYSREIAHLVSMVPKPRLSRQIVQALHTLLEMLETGYKAFRTQDPLLLARVEELEKTVDDAYHSSLKSISEGEDMVERSTAICALLARHMERIADHIVYIAKQASRYEGT